MSELTGQFHPEGTGSQSDPGGLAVLGSTLFYVGNGQSATTIHVKLCDLSSEAITDSSAWLKYDLPADQLLFHDNSVPQTDSGMAAVTLDGVLYCFWSDIGSSHDSNCYATSTSDAEFNESARWHQHIRLYSDPSGNAQLNAPQGPVVAFGYDGQITLLCMANSKQDILVLRYDPAAVVKEGDDYHWYPRHAGVLTVDEVNSAFPDFRKDDGKIGSSFSADWATDGTDNYLMLGCYSDSDDGINLLALELNDNGLPLLSGYVRWLDGGDDGVCVRRDPAGRVRVYTADDSHELQVFTIDTGSGMSADSGVLLNGEQHDLQGAARAVFVVKDPVVSDNRSEAECYEIVLYADRGDNSYGDIMCQAAFFGTVVTDARCETVDYSSLQESVPYILDGIMEAFPLPADGSTNIAAGSELVDVTYGTSTSSGTSHRVEESRLFGARTEGKLTVSNVSAVWETNFKAGPTSASGSSERTTRSEEKVGWTVGGSGAMDPNGSLFFAGVKMTRDDYYLLAPDGQRVEGGPALTTFYPLSATRHNGHFGVYASTPGDLESYTRKSINDTMDRLFPPNCEYRRTYGDWDNYVEDVILPAAVELGGNGDKALQFAFDSNSEWSDKFHQVTSSFTESGWKVTDEAWAGLASEATTREIFFGWDFTSDVKTMVGTVFEMTTNTTTEQEQSWGIDVALTSSAQRFSFNESYTVLMYLLPANERWTAELKALNVSSSLASIDPASRPWRIFYEIEFA